MRNDFVGATDTDTGTAIGVGAVPTADDPSIALEDRHSRDADFIMGDNANVYRLVGRSGTASSPSAFLAFTYDSYSAVERIIPRAYTFLDYTQGGAATDIGAPDLVHGESGDDTVYAGCGAEAVVSSRALRYYLGWHGPLLAPNGSAFPLGTTVAAVESALGDAGHWPVVAHEIRGRDPPGYASLVSPGHDAPEGARLSSSLALKILVYFGMASSVTPGSTDPKDWILDLPFSDRWRPADGSGRGFVIEIGPTVRGGLEFKTWAELPDGRGLPNHPSWTCGPL